MVRTLFIFIVRSGMLRLRVAGQDNVPSAGAIMLMSNHQSNLDPVILGLPLARPISIPGKAELFRVPLFGPLLRILGAYPVDRGAADAASLRQSLRVLRHGGLLAVFPEGTRSRSGVVGDFRPTLVKVALHQGVPIVPAAVAGSGLFLPPGRSAPRPGATVAVSYGLPIEPAADARATSESALGEAVALVRQRVLAEYDNARALASVDSTVRSA
jgi:1-acyl-sn-glycerol-3-phosphate acyltransferase